MKKTKKYLRFEDIVLTTTQEHPRDISRAHFKIIDPSNSYKTTSYATVEPLKVHWTTPIQFPFEAQQSLQFETVCEHEYGYQIEELKALYNGIIYLKPDQFFFTNSTHCLNQEGVQCGVLKFMVKIVEKYEQRKGEQKSGKEVPIKEPVKVSLVAKISIYGAALAVNSYYLNSFQKKKTRRDLKLEIGYDNQTFKGQSRTGELEYKWSINGKFQVNDNSPELICFTINQDNHRYLEGTLPLSTLQANKRFTVQIVQLVDHNDENIASLHLDLRYISKKQLLDLMYSPKQLSDNKMERREGEAERETKHFSRSRVGSVIDGIHKEKDKKLHQLLHNRSLSKELLSSRARSPINSHRYRQAKLDHKNSNIPMSMRFRPARDVNQHAGYIDPSLFSDFSPQQHGGQGGRKGATQSSTNKTDFTKQVRANPGVGQYHLPSIWEKK